MTDIAKLDRLQYYFIGRKELASKVTGLCRLRVCFLINLSSDAVLVDKYIKTISITQDFKHLSNEIDTSIIDIFNNVSPKQKLMIYSDDVDQSRLGYCCIAIKYLQIHLNILVQEFKNRSIDRSTRVYDDCNYTELTLDEIKYLIQFETDIYGESSYRFDDIKSSSVVSPPEQKQEPINDHFDWIDESFDNYDDHNFNDHHDSNVRPPDPVTTTTLLDYNDMKYDNSNHNSSKRSDPNRCDDFELIMNVIGPRINPNIVKDMLKTGSSTASIIDILTSR
jgi:hypothetical protein